MDVHEAAVITLDMPTVGQVKGQANPAFVLKFGDPFAQDVNFVSDSAGHQVDDELIHPF